MRRPGAGPPAAHRRLLKDQAATLRKWPGAAVDGAWELCYSDGKKVLYVGRGPVEKLLTWAKAAASADKSALADEPPPVVVITGLVTVRCNCCARQPVCRLLTAAACLVWWRGKQLPCITARHLTSCCRSAMQSGKSYTQQHVVPAAVAKVLDEQGDEGRLSGMVVLRLDASLLGRSVSKLWGGGQGRRLTIQARGREKLTNGQDLVTKDLLHVNSMRFPTLTMARVVRGRYHLPYRTLALDVVTSCVAASIPR